MFQVNTELATAEAYEASDAEADEKIDLQLEQEVHINVLTFLILLSMIPIFVLLCK